MTDWYTVCCTVLLRVPCRRLLWWKPTQQLSFQHTPFRHVLTVFLLFPLAWGCRSAVLYEALDDSPDDMYLDWFQGQIYKYCIPSGTGGPVGPFWLQWCPPPYPPPLLLPTPPNVPALLRSVDINCPLSLFFFFFLCPQCRREEVCGEQGKLLWTPRQRHSKRLHFEIIGTPCFWSLCKRTLLFTRWLCT